MATGSPNADGWASPPAFDPVVPDPPAPCPQPGSGPASIRSCRPRPRSGRPRRRFVRRSSPSPRAGWSAPCLRPGSCCPGRPPLETVAAFPAIGISSPSPPRTVSSPASPRRKSRPSPPSINRCHRARPPGRRRHRQNGRSLPNKPPGTSLPAPPLHRIASPAAWPRRSSHGHPRCRAARPAHGRHPHIEQVVAIAAARQVGPAAAMRDVVAIPPSSTSSPASP